MLVKILGAIDLIAAFTFLMMLFDIQPYLQVILFCAVLLMLKGMFIFTGDVLSIVDILSALALIASLLITLPAMILWAPFFFLLAKGFLSFI